MKTEKINGFFDVRKFDKKVERKDRKIAPEGDQIALMVSYELKSLPEAFKVGDAPDEFVRLYSSRDEVKAAEAEGRQAVADRASVKFKIGTGTKWFDKFGRATTKPSNEELDGKHFEVQVEYRRRPKNPADTLAPSGYWANAIMFREVEQNPFAGDAFETADEPEQTEQVDTDAKPEGGTDLPF